MSVPTFLNTRQLAKRLIRDAADGRIVIGPPVCRFDDGRPIFVAAGSNRDGFWHACVLLTDTESYEKIATAMRKKLMVYRVVDPDELTALCRRLWPCAATLALPEMTATTLH